MRFLLVTLLYFTFLPRVSGDDSATIDLSQVPTPPTFVHPPNKPVLWFVVHNAPISFEKSHKPVNTKTLKERTFNCRAEGLPQPHYYWKKDGKVWNLDDESDRVTKVGWGDEGTFRFKELKQTDAGTYQCFAHNDNGTAVDAPIIFKQTHISPFPVEEPEVISVEWMQPYTHECVPPQSDPSPSVFWLLSGNSDTHQFSSLNGTYISQIKDGDKGMIFFSYVDVRDADENKLIFTCGAVNKVLNDFKFGNRFRLRIRNPEDVAGMHIRKDPVEQFVSQNTITMKRGETLQLHCIFSGFPPVMPEWKKVQEELPEEKLTYINSGRTLQIENLDTSDEGEYECNFKGNPGLNRRFTIQIQAAPYWVSYPKSLNSSVGLTESFVCGAVGHPTPKISFYKNGQPLESDGSEVMIDNNKLEIRNIEKGTNGDNAGYQCKAENEYGSVWASFYLNVMSIAPIVQIGPGTVESIAESTRTISCQIFGSPTPKVEWYHDGEKITDERKFEMKQENGKATLLIKTVEKWMKGKYSCKGTNNHGDAEGSGNLIVMEPTKIIEGPQTVFPSKKSTIIAGTEVRMKCKVTHDAQLAVDVHWEVNERIIDENEEGYRLLGDDENTLVIPSPTTRESGEYVCLVKTALDSREERVELIVKDVPSSPFEVHLDCKTKNLKTVYIYWKHLDSAFEKAPVQYYLIQWNAGFDPNAWHTHPELIAVNPKGFNSERTYQDGAVVPVTPWGDYTMRVIARNEIGDSPPSDPSALCVTAPDVPVVAPKNVEVQGTGPNSFTIKWTKVPHEEWYGPSLEYIVRYREQDTEEWEEVTLGENDDHFVVDQAKANVLYDVEVTLRNMKGISTAEPVKLVGKTSSEAPSAVPGNFTMKSATNPQAAVFTWDPVPQDALDSGVLGYKILHWSESGKRDVDPEKKEALFDPHASEGAVFDLTPYAENFAQIQVYGDGGTGPPSPTINFTMPEGTPSQLTALHAYSLTDNEIAIVWQPPRFVNGILKGYNVSWRQYLGEADDGTPKYTESHMEAFTNVDQNSYRAMNLQPETEYRFTVSGVTIQGSGEPKSVLVKTLPQDVDFADTPLQPQYELTGIGKDHINVTWIPAMFNETAKQPVGHQFYFKYRMPGEESWHTAHPDGGSLRVKIPNLTPATKYEIKAVSLAYAKSESPPKYSESPVGNAATIGHYETEATGGWLIAIIVAIIILIIILIIVCIVVRNSGSRYPVSKREMSQGREPMLKDKSFNEYPRIDDPERQSLTGAMKPASDTDSMAEYGNIEPGSAFGEDGSFIGLYTDYPSGAVKNRGYAGSENDKQPTAV